MLPIQIDKVPALRNGFWDISLKRAVDCNGKRKAFAVRIPDVLSACLVISLGFSFIILKK